MLPSDNHTPTPHDLAVVTLLRTGLDVDTIYATLWPSEASRPYPLDTFRQVARALDLADATATPPEELPPDLEAIVDDLLIARRQIMSALEAKCDVNDKGGFDNQAHVALVKNAEAVLKYQTARQDRQVHRLNLRVAAEKARLELMALYDEAKRN